MEYIVTITGVCPGGNHVHANVTKGGVLEQMVFEKEDFAEDNDSGFLSSNEKRALVREIRKMARKAGVRTFAQLRTYVTNLSVTL